LKDWDKLIVALDCNEKSQIYRVVKALAPKKVKFKIGSIAFTKFGPQLLKSFISRKIDIFLDLKLYDIPNTMKQTAAVMTEMGCWAFTVHIRAGQEALESVRDEVARISAAKKMRKPLVLGVTELTSSEATKTRVVELADQARIAGIDGVIASAQEASAIKARFDNHLLVVTPGIRNPQDDKDDQERITTAQTAFAQGADYIVVGRPIISKQNYLKAAREILSA
jgi:orotidine-5'-phosphate decarboxylase